jgi:hypothetical protein
MSELTLPTDRNEFSDIGLLLKIAGAYSASVPTVVSDEYGIDSAYLVDSDSCAAFSELQGLERLIAAGLVESPGSVNMPMGIDGQGLSIAKNVYVFSEIGLQAVNGVLMIYRELKD